MPTTEGDTDTRAQSTSLYIPDFDPQPISTDVLGVKPNGETMYRIQRGQPTGMFVAADIFPGTSACRQATKNSRSRIAVPYPQPR